MVILRVDMVRSRESLCQVSMETANRRQGTILLMFTLPETLPSRVLTNKARRIRKVKVPGYENVQSPVEAANQSLASIFRVALTRPVSNTDDGCRQL